MPLKVIRKRLPTILVILLKIPILLKTFSHRLPATMPIFPKTLPEMVQQIMVTTLLKVVRHKDSVIILVLLEIFKQKNREEEHEMS